MKKLSVEKVKETTLDYSLPEFSQIRNIDLLRDIDCYLADQSNEFKPCKEFKDLFTPDIQQKITNANKYDFYDDLYASSNQKCETKDKDISMSKDEIEF